MCWPGPDWASAPHNRHTKHWTPHGTWRRHRRGGESGSWASSNARCWQWARRRGIATWVSIEPVISPDQAIELIQRYHTLVDHWKVGKVNYLPEIEKSVDWHRFRDEITRVFESVGADFYLKKSLSDLE